MLRTIAFLVKGALPAVAVATLIPMAVFYAVMSVGSLEWAIGISAVYAYGVAIYQYARHRRVSGMLCVTVLLTTMRILAAAVSGQLMLYFAVPVVETAGFALMFAATMWSSEPLVVRLARDLVPHAADGIAARRSLIRTLSLLWTVTYLASCATSLTLLLTAPLPLFLGFHTLTGWFWTGSGMALTLKLCQRRARGLIMGEALQPVAA